MQLFAHFVWNSSILAADLIASGTFKVQKEVVLELGAGAGLPGIVAALCGASFVVLTDYESPRLIDNLRHNVQKNIPTAVQEKVKVTGHTWGEDTESITQ